MARATVLGRLTWRVATVAAVRDETSSARTLVLDVPDWPGHLAGQHVDVRLTAPDGYSTQRSYSIASAPAGNRLELTVDVLPDGEVSPYLARVLSVGDPLEIRGPIGGWFVWDADAPALLVGGGSGLVPLMSMLRLARRLDRSHLVRLVVSVRSPADLYYAHELPGPEVRIIYSREAPPGEARPPGRLTTEDLRPAPDPAATTYLCGSAGFAEAASRLLVDVGVPVERIRVERFGPSG
jgi:ferredoxin-NADP reductase